MMSKIEEYVNLYGVINPKLKAYFDKLKKSQQIARDTDEYFRKLGLQK